MKARTSLGSLGPWMAIALLLTSCSKATAPEVDNGTTPTNESPNSYPPVPRPTTPDEVIPDTSEVYTLVMPIADKGVDFAPTWSDGIFTWRVDIQTQYFSCGTTCDWSGDKPGIYWRGTAASTEMTFENGTVDLRDPEPFYGSSRRIQFVDKGHVLAAPHNPENSDIYFNFFGGYPSVKLTGLFGGSHIVPVTPGFLEKQRRRMYYVAALSCPPITSPVYLKRERFWVRLPLVGNGSNLKSIRVDPGSSFSVSYTRTEGTSTANAKTFTRSINAEVGPETPGNVIGVTLGGSLSEAFETTVTITEEHSSTVTRTMSGIEGKTVIYSVWASVERYSVVDKDGNPYTDRSFTFDDLGTAKIQGEYEWISSTAFPYP